MYECTSEKSLNQKITKTSYLNSIRVKTKSNFVKKMQFPGNFLSFFLFSVMKKNLTKKFQASVHFQTFIRTRRIILVLKQPIKSFL